MLLLLVVTSSCNRTRIEGRVLNGFGKPVKDATVKVEGTQFVTTTNSDGEYSVGYVPGNIKVSITKDGFTDTSFSVNIATEAKYPAATVIVYEVPKEHGIYLMQNEQYKPFSKGSVRKQNYTRGDWLGMSQSDVYFVNFDENNITSIKQQDSTFSFLDCDPRPIALFKIATNTKGNIILTRSTGGGGAGFMMGDYNDNALFVNEKFQHFKKGENNITLRLAKLDEGLYAFAQYNKRGSPAINGELSVFRVVK